MNLSLVDLVLLTLYMVGSVALGLWLGRGQKTATDYMLGSRDLPAWTVLLSIVATETSTVTFLSIPGVAYHGDLTFLQLPLGYLIGRVVITMWLLPKYFAGEFFTAYQVLELRFGGRVKEAASLLFLVTRTLADGLRLYLTAVMLQLLSGMNMNAAIAVMGAVTIVYTYLGGMKAVVWTDVMQFFVYLAGAVASYAALVGKLPGGFATVVETAQAHGKLRVFDLSLDLAKPFTLWAGVIGGAVLALGTHGTDQLMVQRYLCARSERDARHALLASGVVVLLQFALFLWIGIALFAFFRAFPPAVPLTKQDHVFPAFIVEHLQQPPGLLGLVLGAVFAAAMSTLSSSLNSSATALVNDLWCPRFAPAADTTQRLKAARLATLLFGVLQIAVGIAGQGLEDSVVNNVLTIAGLTTGALLGVFLLGSGAPRAGQRDALLGLLCGLVVVLLLWLNAWVAWPYFALVGAATTFVTGWLTSNLRAPSARP